MDQCQLDDRTNYAENEYWSGAAYFFASVFKGQQYGADLRFWRTLAHSSSLCHKLWKEFGSRERVDPLIEPLVNIDKSVLGLDKQFGAISKGREVMAMVAEAVKTLFTVCDEKLRPSMVWFKLFGRPEIFAEVVDFVRSHYGLVVIEDTDCFLAVDYDQDWFNIFDELVEIQGRSDFNFPVIIENSDCVQLYFYDDIWGNRAQMQPGIKSVGAPFALASSGKKNRQMRLYAVYEQMTEIQARNRLSEIGWRLADAAELVVFGKHIIQKKAKGVMSFHNIAARFSHDNEGYYPVLNSSGHDSYIFSVSGQATGAIRSVELILAVREKAEEEK